MNTAKRINRRTSHYFFKQISAVTFCNKTHYFSRKKILIFTYKRKKKPTKVTFFFPGQYLSFYKTCLSPLQSAPGVNRKALVSLTPANHKSFPIPAEMKINILSLWGWHSSTKTRPYHFYIYIYFWMGRKAQRKESQTSYILFIFTLPPYLYKQAHTQQFKILCTGSKNYWHYSNQTQNTVICSNKSLQMGNQSNSQVSFYLFFYFDSHSGGMWAINNYLRVRDKREVKGRGSSQIKISQHFNISVPK